MEAGRADAPALLLLHGVGANSMHWRFQFAGLSDAFRVVAWNAPGYILSDAFKTEWPTCKDYADALADFLGALKLDRVNIVGNSFGSRVAQCFAIHYPARVICACDDRHRHRPEGHERGGEGQDLATREGQIAKGGYGFGARVDALLGKNASRADDRPGARCGARHQPARLHAWRQARHGGRLRSRDGGREGHRAGADDLRQRGPREPDRQARRGAREGDADRRSSRSSTASGTCPRSRRPRRSTRCCARSSRSN